MDKFVNSISSQKHIYRLKKLYGTIFLNFQYNDKNVMDFKDFNCLIFDKILNVLCNLIIISKGCFILTNSKVYIFEDKRFFIPLNLLINNEIEFLISLLDSMETLSPNLKLNPKYKHTKLFETLPLRFNISIETRINIINSIFYFISIMIQAYENNALSNELYQFKINVCYDIKDLCYNLEKSYKLDLTNTKTFFDELIKKFKSKDWEEIIEKN